MAVLVQLPGVETPDNLSLSRELSPPGVAHVAILMCTYNGAAFLDKQLDSFEHQAYRNWSLHVSDDGSKDKTRKILKSFAGRWGEHRLKLVDGPRSGFARNFLSLTCRRDIQADYFAWSDQDDVWSTEKLQVAVDWLKTVPANVPALYCGRTQLICEDGNERGLSPDFSLPPHFKNALVQSIGGGNTMVFNQAARSLIMEAGDNLTVPAHDWWCYQLITGVGGLVNYDSQPYVYYRQHDANVIGSSSDWCSRFRRMVRVIEGRFCEWSTLNIHALETMSHRLDSDHRKTLALFKRARRAPLPRRVIGIIRSGLHRQTFMGNLGLILAAVLKKI